MHIIKRIQKVIILLKLRKSNNWYKNYEKNRINIKKLKLVIKSVDEVIIIKEKKLAKTIKGENH